LTSGDRAIADLSSDSPAMFFLKKLPRFSLALMLVTYFNLGWTLSESHSEWWIWVAISLLILSIAEALAAPWSLIRTFLVRWLRSDFRAFVTVMSGAFFAVVLLSWIEVSSQGLILVVAACIARLDLQTGLFRPWQDFLILAFVALVGLSLGGTVHYLLLDR
jgi:hypothetical protein